MRHGGVRRMLSWLRGTPLHPQWFVFRRERRVLRWAVGDRPGAILDIGCASGRPRAFIGAEQAYTGLDYPATATGWYHTRPDVFGDAQRLPFRDGCMDRVLLLDVLEHLPAPAQCLAEIRRVLKPGGRLVLNVPFLYPVHDAPRDFRRWTPYGLRELAARQGFRVAEQAADGAPPETAALLFNLAAAGMVLEWARGRHPAVVLGLLLPPCVLLANLAGWMFGRLARRDAFMAHACRMIWVKGN